MENNELINKKTLEHGATVTGAIAGVATAVAATAAATATTGIAGSALAAMGLTLTAATPIGWVIGGSLLGAAVFKYGAKIINKKGELSGLTGTMDNILKQQVEKRLTEIGLSLSSTDQVKSIELLSLALNNNKITQEMYDDFKLSVDAGSLTLLEISDMLEYPLPQETNQLDEVILLMRSGLAMAAADGVVDSSEVDSIFQYINSHIPISKEDFDYLFDLEHEINKNKVMNQLLFFQISSSFYKTPLVFEKILTMLETIGKADGDFDEYEMHLFHIAKTIFSMSKEADIYIHNSMNLKAYVKNSVTIMLPTEQTLGAYYKKCNTAIHSFAKGLDINDIIAINDSTYFGKSDEGFIITLYGIISHNQGLLLYDWMTDIEVKNDDIFITNREYSTPYIISKLPNPKTFASYLKQFIRIDETIKRYEIGQNIELTKEDKTSQRIQKIAEGMANVEEKVSKIAGLASFTMKSLKSDVSKVVENNESIDDVKEKVGNFFSKMKNKARVFVDENTTKDSKGVNPLSSNQEWHLAQNKNQLGLHSLEDIDRKIYNKELSLDNLYAWKNGMSDWLPVQEIEEIKIIIGKYNLSTPPPLPN